MRELPLAGEPPRERKDAARNRVLILDAARRVCHRLGAAGFTMDAVAAEAGVGKGTLFRRFTDREGLAEALIDAPMREFQDRVLAGPPPLGPGAPPDERLAAFAEEFVRLIVAHLPVALLVAAAPRHRQFRAFGFLVVHVGLLVRESAPGLDPEATARLLLGAMSAPVIADALDHGATPDGVAASMRAVSRGTVRTAPGAVG